MASSFIAGQGQLTPTKVVKPGMTLASSRVGSYQNQALGGLTTGLSGSVGSQTTLPDTSYSPPALDSLVSQKGLTDSIAKSNARMNALATAAQAKRKVTLPGYTAPSGVSAQGQQPVGNMTPVGNGQFLRKDVATKFNQLQNAFRQGTGGSLGLTQGWRSYADQVRLYNLYRSGKGNLAAKPGTSEHGTGTALDINGYGDPNGARFKWLLSNAAQYGFSWQNGKRYGEPWHWEYVG